MAGNAMSFHQDSPRRYDSHSSRTTPPTQTGIPLTPPATAKQESAGDRAQVLQMLDATNGSPTPQPLNKAKVAPEVYENLAELIDSRVRQHDYDPKNEDFVIRMPSPIHEFFSAFVAEKIRDQLRHIARKDNEIGRFASSIQSGGSSRIFLREGDSESDKPRRGLRRQPDEQFQHKAAAYPGVVIEISYSQDGKNLQKLAEDYILYSNGDIKLVVGIDINDGKECTVSSWRPQYTPREKDDFYDLCMAQDIKYLPFRSSNGTAVNGEDGISISLNDFATDAIPCNGQAEEMQKAREPDEGKAGLKSRVPTKKRKLSSSLAEELRSGDEARFIEEERQVMIRDDARDGDYITLGAKRR